jgi:hypothetical protein
MTTWREEEKIDEKIIWVIVEHQRLIDKTNQWSESKTFSNSFLQRYFEEMRLIFVFPCLKMNIKK